MVACMLKSHPKFGNEICHKTGIIKFTMLNRGYKKSTYLLTIIELACCPVGQITVHIIG